MDALITATVPLAPSRKKPAGRKPWILLSLGVHLAAILALILVIPRMQPEQEAGSPQGIEMVFEQPSRQPSPPGVPNLPKPGTLPAPTAPPVPNAPPALSAPTAPPPPQAPPSVNLTVPPPPEKQAIPLPPAVPPVPPSAEETPQPPPPPEAEAAPSPVKPLPAKPQLRPPMHAVRPTPQTAQRAPSLSRPMVLSFGNAAPGTTTAAFFNPFSKPPREQPPSPADDDVGSSLRTAAGMLAPFAYFPNGDPGPDFRQSLMAWWLAHRFYPVQAVERGEDGDVHLSLVVDRLGRVKEVELNGGSGSQWLDMAGESTWRNAQLIPIPDRLGRDQIVIDLTLHYILVRR